jgi:LacI family transcriptional regulator
MITIKEIAQLAGVSYSTVAKALKNNPLVKPATKKKITDIAEQHNYRVNILASRLVSGESKLIGVVLRSVNNPVFSNLALQLNEMLQERGYQMILSVSSDGIPLFNQLCVDGIIYWGDSLSVQSLKAEVFESSRTPTIILGSYVNEHIPSIQIDRKDGIFKAVEHLVSYGHRRIGLIGDSQSVKLNAYRDAVSCYKLEHSSEFVVQAHASWEDGYLALKNYAFHSGSPTAFIGINNLLTQGALRALIERGIHVPQQLSLIGYDDVPEMEHADVPMTTVGPVIKEIAQSATEAIIALIKNHKPEPEQEIWVKPVMHHRKSVGPVPSGKTSVT